MALEIMIVPEQSKPYWECEDSTFFGDIDPGEWESLLFKDFDVMDYTKYGEAGFDLSTYDQYYADRITSLEADFPLVLRIRNYYKDVFFSREEIGDLRSEIRRLQKMVNLEPSKRLLKQLDNACEAASKNNSGISLIAD